MIDRLQIWGDQNNAGDQADAAGCYRLFLLHQGGKGRRPRALDGIVRRAEVKPHRIDDAIVGDHDNPLGALRGNRFN
ncbi:hypothetical protein ACFSUD_16430 [Sulfitobacter aestuarii]|uniref:Uncharacterized protein n=1 Tax=Sulfitobacter aestuarii TaxID=2161676 RepID=A0ABW5U5R1_9RHOB